MFREEESKRVVLERWPEGGEEMKFRLVYDGELPSEQRGPAAVKQQIRRQFHPQLRSLWEQHPWLSDKTKDRSPDRRTVDKIAAAYNKCGFNFVPLVRESNGMACRLEILVLLRKEPYRVFTGGGDLDNRIKTLIDGLRMPGNNCTELAGAVPEAGEDPFFCLLDDDKLIYEFNVTTDRLLAPVRPEQAARDVVTIIHVHITNTDRSEIMALSQGFGLV